ncbi:hypothetical protein [Humibacter sp.]|uniref:hypothetical protein n=1 Tax=Humibacter sp. TaxID=1940291 RepID=UPI003F7F0942
MPYADPAKRYALSSEWARKRRVADPEWAEQQRTQSRERNRARYAADPAYRAARAEYARRRRAQLKEARESSAVDTRRLRRAHVALVDAFVDRHPSPYNREHWAKDRAKIVRGGELRLGTLELPYALAAAGYRAEAEAVEQDKRDRLTWLTPADGGPVTELRL